MTIKQTVENFLSTPNLPDNTRNWGQGFQFMIKIVEDEKVTKKALREIYNGANRNSDSGRILNPELANFDKVMLHDIINATSDENIKSKMTTLLGEIESWLNS